MFGIGFDFLGWGGTDAVHDGLSEAGAGNDGVVEFT